MKVFNYFRQKERIINHKKAIRKFSAVDTLIEKKMLLLDTKNYHAAMLDNLWELYPTGELKINFCQNLKYYCDLQNAYHGYEVNKNSKLVISLKYENNEVLPYAYFDGNNIILYQEEMKK